MFFAIVVLCDTGVHAQQRQAASYTRYELLSPESQSFRIIYDVSATTAGVKKLFQHDSQRQRTICARCV